MATDPAPHMRDNLTAAIQILRDGEFKAMRLTPYGSNETLDSIIAGKVGASIRAIYKPMWGEAPLWDFPSHTLYKRERAAFLLSQALGWDFVPLTLIREGPRGIGTVQMFIPHDPNQHFFTLRHDHADEFRRFAVFDIIANNADRKSTHCLADGQGRIWSIDHGITFNAEYKLRTVIWDYAGQSVPGPFIDDLKALDTQLREGSPFVLELDNLLNSDEVEALCGRIQALLQHPVFPDPDPYRRSYPWPMA